MRVLVSAGQGPADRKGHFSREQEEEDEGRGTVVGVMLCLLMPST